jgi:hypothetical protein
MIDFSLIFGELAPQGTPFFLKMRNFLKIDEFEGPS